jgi:hypothetical protein
MNADREGVWDMLLIILSGFEGWFCVLSGFVDETHKQEGLPLTGVGGFIFRKEALSALQLELSGIDGAEHSASSLRRWGRLDVINQLARTIARHKGIGFACTVTNEVFEEWQRSSPENKNWLGPPYSACVLAMLGMVSQYLQMNHLTDAVFYTI